MSKIEEKLSSLGISLPTPAAPVANYVGFVKSGNQVIISGQLPFENGKLAYIGKVGSEISSEDAQKGSTSLRCRNFRSIKSGMRWRLRTC